jgi:hypothetical protein
MTDAVRHQRLRDVIRKPDHARSFHIRAPGEMNFRAATSAW